MRYKMPLAAAGLAIAMMSVPAISSAAALPGASQATTTLGQQSLLTEQVGWRRRGWRHRKYRKWRQCRRWRRRCSRRWGWGSRRFDRCMYRRGC